MTSRPLFSAPTIVTGSLEPKDDELITVEYGPLVGRSFTYSRVNFGIPELDGKGVGEVAAPAYAGEVIWVGPDDPSGGLRFSTVDSNFASLCQTPYARLTDASETTATAGDWVAKSLIGFTVASEEYNTHIDPVSVPNIYRGMYVSFEFSVSGSEGPGTKYGVAVGSKEGLTPESQPWQIDVRVLPPDYTAGTTVAYHTVWWDCDNLTGANNDPELRVYGITNAGNALTLTNFEIIKF